MGFIAEFMQMMKDSRIFKYSVIINLVYVIWNILINIWGLTSLAHVWLLWQWSTAYNQEIASGFDFTFFFRAAYDLLFNLGQIVTESLIFSSNTISRFSTGSSIFYPFVTAGFQCWLCSLVRHQFHDFVLFSRSDLSIS